MYIPKEFTESDRSELLRFLRAHPLGIVIHSVDVTEPSASHIPFVVREENGQLVLEGHLSRANGQLEQLKNDKPVLVVFQGPNAYISSSVYTHENVPTWNYQAVHLYGVTEIMDMPELVKHLEESVEYFESQRHRKLAFSDFSEAMISDYLKDISGIRIRTYKIEAAYKMSQNRNETDHANIVADLESSPASNDRETAAAMKAISNHKKR